MPGPIGSSPAIPAVMAAAASASAAAASTARAAVAAVGPDDGELDKGATVRSPTAVFAAKRHSRPLPPVRLQGTPPPGAASEPTRPFGRPPRDTDQSPPAILRGPEARQPTGEVVEALRQTLQSNPDVQLVSGHVGFDHKLYLEAVAMNGNNIQLVLPATMTAEVGLSILFQLSAVLTAPASPQPLQVKLRFEPDTAFESECRRHSFSAAATQRAYDGGIVKIQMEGPAAKKATHVDVVDDAAVVSPQRITLSDLSQKGTTLIVELILPQSAAQDVETIDRHLVNAKAQLTERLRMITEGDEAPVLDLFRAAAPAALVAVLASAAYAMGMGGETVMLGGLWALFRPILERGGIPQGPSLTPAGPAMGHPGIAMASVPPPDSGAKTVMGDLPLVPAPGAAGPSPSGRLHLGDRATWMRADSNVVAELTEVKTVDGRFEIVLPSTGPAMQLSVGRMDGNGLKLGFNTVSRQHALVTWDPVKSELSVSDRASHNGSGLAMGEATGPLWSRSDEFRESRRSVRFDPNHNAATVRFGPEVTIIFRLEKETP